MEQQRDLEQLLNLTRDPIFRQKDDESNNESDTVIPGPNCRGLVRRHAVKLLGFVVMVFCVALLVFWRSSILTSRMEVQKEFSAQHQMEISGGTQVDNSRTRTTNNYYGQKSQKHQEIADLPADDNLCKMMHTPRGITLPVMGGSQWKKMAAPGGTYCGPLSPMHKLPETPTVGHSVGHAWLMDGTQYAGPWKHGQPDSDCQLVSGHVQCHGGKGTFYYADGKKKHGYWHGTAFCSDDAAVSRKPQCITDWGLVKTLEDAEDWSRIYFVAFNDKFLAAGGDKKVHIYSIEEDWKLVKSLEDAEEHISSVAFNDKYFALGSWKLAAGGFVRIYQNIWQEEIKLVKTLEDAETGYSIAFNDKYLAAGCLDKKVHIYSIEEDFKLMKTLEDAETDINSVAFDKYLAAGCLDKKVHIYSIEEDFKLVKTLEDAEEAIYSIAFNDKFLAAGGDDKKVRIYSTKEDWKLVKTLEDAEEAIYSIAFNDKYLAAGRGEKKVRIYSIEE